jgi:hypothetical protein
MAPSGTSSSPSLTAEQREHLGRVDDALGAGGPAPPAQPGHPLGARQEPLALAQCLLGAAAVGDVDEDLADAPPALEVDRVVGGDPGAQLAGRRVGGAVQLDACARDAAVADLRQQRLDLAGDPAGQDLGHPAAEVIGGGTAVDRGQRLRDELEAQAVVVDREADRRVGLHALQERGGRECLLLGSDFHPATLIAWPEAVGASPQ